MNRFFTKFHTSILLIIFIVAIASLGIGLREDFFVQNEGFTNYSEKKTLFNIDNEIESQKEFLGWKGFWRKNYSNLSNNIEKIFTNKPFSSCKETKLYYDGIYKNPPFKH